MTGRRFRRFQTPGRCPIHVGGQGSYPCPVLGGAAGEGRAAPGERPGSCIFGKERVVFQPEYPPTSGRAAPLPPHSIPPTDKAGQAKGEPRRAGSRGCGTLRTGLGPACPQPGNLSPDPSAIPRHNHTQSDFPVALPEGGAAVTQGVGCRGPRKTSASLVPSQGPWLWGHPSQGPRRGPNPSPSPSLSSDSRLSRGRGRGVCPA